MPRDASGNVTLVAGNPVVADTDIVTSWANPTMADLASMIQDSLSRSGKGGMLVPFPFEDGTVTTPSITFKNDSKTGFYRPAAKQLAMTIFGVLKALYTETLQTFKTSVKVEGDLTVTGKADITGNLTVTGDLAVTGSMGITRPDLPAVGQQLSTSCGNWGGTTSTTPVDVTNLTVSITTTGRPVVLALVPDGTTGPSSISVLTTAAMGGARFQFVRGTTSLGVAELYTIAASAYALPSYFVLDVPVAGTYTYKFQMYVTVNTVTAGAAYMKLLAYEL